MAKEPTQTADEDPQNPSHLQPYPTGNPPDPMEEYYKAHPERRPPAEAPKAADKKLPESAPEDDQPDEGAARNTKKGK